MTPLPGQLVTFRLPLESEPRTGWFVREGAGGRYWISATPGGSSGWWIAPEQVISVGEVPSKKGKRK